MPFMGEKLEGGGSTSAYPCPNEFKENGGHMLLVRIKFLPSQSDLYWNIFQCNYNFFFGLSDNCLLI